MPARTHLRASPVASVLGLVAVIVCSVGFARRASAGPLFASSTKHGNDGHPYYWSAPC